MDVHPVETKYSALSAKPFQIFQSHPVSFVLGLKSTRAFLIFTYKINLILGMLLFVFFWIPVLA